ncbi:MAG: hypothetical protein V3S71_00195 [Acidobacteriota bacterium]
MHPALTCGGVFKTPVFAKLLLILGCAAVATLAPAQKTDPHDAWQRPEDHDLRHALAALERGFQHENLSQLGRVFPRKYKVLVRWNDPVQHDGLLTGTQVILFLRDLFLKYRTISFKLQAGALLPPGRMYHCMGRWSLASGKSQAQKIELHFSLKEDGGAWTVRELRQTR